MIAELTTGFSIDATVLAAAERSAAWLERRDPRSNAVRARVLHAFLAEIESSLVRNRSWDELKTITTAQSKKYLPLDLRPKYTRAIRRRLSKKDASRVTEKQRKKQTHFPVRKYAVKAN